MKRTRLHSDPAKVRAWRERSRKPLKRTTPLKARPKSAEEKAAIESARKALFERSGGFCERRTHSCCRGWVPLDGNVFERGHAAHRIRKDKLPKAEQWNPKYLDWSCYECHIIAEHSMGIKPTNTDEGERGRA